MLLESMEKSTFIEKYKALYKHTNELLSDKFGDIMASEDIQEMNKAILDLYEQVLLYLRESQIYLLSLQDCIYKCITLKII
jgi:hypothetical protein